METIVINFSKRKISWLILYSNIFLIGGILFICKSSEISEKIPVFNSKNLNEMFGVFILITWFFSIFYLIKIYFSNKPGLIIDDDGIENNSSAFKNKIILWNDVKGIEIKVQNLPMLPSQKYLRIIFRNTNRSPKDISTNSLDIHLSELFEIVEKRLH